MAAAPEPFQDPPRLTLSDPELSTLALLCDALVPPIAREGEDKGFYGRSATDIGVDRALADIITTKLEPYPREQIRRLLRVLESRGYGLVLNASATPFSKLSAAGREGLLKGWRDSRLGTKRAGFQGVKKLVLLLYYASTDAQGLNPNWKPMGYPGPQSNALVPQPPAMQVVPLDPKGASTLECDVCVIGAGAGGSVIAYELSKAGLDVLVLEAGGYQTSATFEQRELGMMDQLFWQHGLATTKDFSFILLAGRGGGGGTLVNWMTCMRPPAPVLSEWELEHGVRGAAGPTFEGYVDEVWRTLRVNGDESQRNISNEALWRGCAALGYLEGSDYEVIQRNAVGCDQRCAFCTYGCRYSCKQSTVMNYLPMASGLGARLMFGTTVENIELEGGRAVGVSASRIEAGKRRSIEVRSRAVVVACGATQTPALLIRSGIRGRNIGRNLRIHPTTGVNGVFPGMSGPWDGPPQTVAVRKFSDLDGKGHGFWVEAIPVHPGLFALAAPWVDGASHKDFMLSKYSHSAATIALVRDWGSGKVDVDKRGSPSVTYDLDGRDVRHMLAGIRETARILAAAGASELWSYHSVPAVVKAKDERISQSELDSFFGQVNAKGIRPNGVLMGSAHLMGSCRIGIDESTGACNPQGELYGFENLFVGDASVFPTAPGVNPMVTIMAMAIRTAEFVRLKLNAG